jgi:HlyD family secretion protein
MSISGALVTRLLVAAGDDVSAGQLLAVTDTVAVMDAQVLAAEAGYELAVQQARAERSRAEETCVRSRVAERESDRRAALLQKGVAGAEEAEMAAGQAQALAASCAAAQTVIAVAEAQIIVAEKRVAVQKAERERSFVYAPVAGRILEITAGPGELAGAEGVLQMGEVDQMYAIAEVYETDIGRVHIGQKASVSSDALPHSLTGTVEKIRFKVARQDQISTDPAARKDARIVEVEILLDDAAAAANLTHLQVDVLIQP